MSALAIRQMAEFKTKGWTELVTYYPYNGKPRTLDALVDRGQVVDALNVLIKELTVTVMNDEIYGIAPQLMDRGGDRIEIAERHGKELLMREIQRIIKHDEEWVVLAVS